MCMLHITDAVILNLIMVAQPSSGGRVKEKRCGGLSFLKAIESSQTDDGSFAPRENLYK